jgi:hypothetical protein
MCGISGEQMADLRTQVDELCDDFRIPVPLRGAVYIRLLFVEGKLKYEREVERRRGHRTHVRDRSRERTQAP